MLDLIRIDNPLAAQVSDPIGRTWSTSVTEIGESSLILAEGISGLPFNTTLTIEITDPDLRSVKLHGAILEHGNGTLVAIAQDSFDLLSHVIGVLRKDQHIDIARFQDVEGSGHKDPFEDTRLIPNALAELNIDDIDTSVRFLGANFALPILITGMTGGLKKGSEINRNLAHAASALNIPMGVGSQRVALLDPELSRIFRVREPGKPLFLIGNIGAAQLLTANAVDGCERAVDMIEADALAIHLNLMQELVQVEGDRKFVGIVGQIEKVCKRLKVPVIVKEVGFGIHSREVKRLIACGVHAVDIGGRGGTSWARIEGLRSSSPRVQRLGETFRDWGLSTAECLKLLDDEARMVPIIATGGIRSGLHVAKAIALKASMVGVGLPLFRAACVSQEAVMEELQTMALELKIAMLASGAKTLRDLPHVLAPLR